MFLYKKENNSLPFKFTLYQPDPLNFTTIVNVADWSFKEITYPRNFMKDVKDL